MLASRDVQAREAQRQELLRQLASLGGKRERLNDSTLRRRRRDLESWLEAIL